MGFLSAFLGGMRSVSFLCVWHCPGILEQFHSVGRRTGSGEVFRRCRYPYVVDGKKGLVTPKPTMWWLRIFFDSKLTFHSHIKIMCNQARSVITGFRCLSNTVCSLSQRHLCLLYKTCAIPVMTYTSPVWFRSDKKQQTLLNRLETTQNHALRLIAGCF